MGYFILETFGSDGDILPFLHIGRELIRRGHRVCLFTHCHYEKMAGQAGFDFVATDTPAEYEQFIKNSALAQNPQGALRFFHQQLLPNLLTNYQSLAKLHHPGETLIIHRAAPGIIPWLAGEKLGIPRVAVFLAPSFIINKPFLEAIYQNQEFTGALNKIRTRIGLPPEYHWQSWWESAQENIGFWPDWFAGPSPEWSVSVKTVGFITDTNPAGAIPEKVRELLAGRQKPILINGSTGTLFVKSDFYEASLNACRILGETGILVARHHEFIPQPLPEGIHHFDFLPFNLLMPKMKAIIHHGGIGTSAQALASGIPQLILPVGADRPDNAAHLRNLGVGEYLLPPQWKPEIVAEALRRVTTSPPVFDSCREIAVKMKQSNSLGAACDVIESVLRAANQTGDGALRLDDQSQAPDTFQAPKFQARVSTISQANTNELIRLTENLSQEQLELLALLLKKDQRQNPPKADIIPRLARTGEGDTFPLSYAQERLWFLHKLDPESPAYNNPFAFQLNGALDIARLKRALDEIIARHEILRTAFCEADGKPFQLITPELKLDLPVINLQDIPLAEREEAAKRMIQKAAWEPYHLSRLPLIRVLLLRFNETRHILFVGMHHIVNDGWGGNIFMREMAAFYTALATPETPAPALPELPIQYADFAKWQREWLQSPEGEAKLAYWNRQLSGSPLLLTLPADFSRPPVQTFQGGEQLFSISPALTGSLKALSRERGTTLFMTLLAIFKIFVFRHTHQTDIVIGTPIANRNRRELEDLIGCFVNMLALRTNLEGNPDFLTLLERVKQVAAAAYEHQDAPFERIVDGLKLERNISQTPLFQILFAFQNMPQKEQPLAGLSLETFEFERQLSQFDISLLFIENTGQGLDGVFKYNRALFRPETVCRFMNHFLVLLEAALGEPKAGIMRLPLLTEAERRQIMQWNETRADFPKLHGIHQLFERQATQTPDALALVFGEQALTYSELNAKANQLAGFLRKKGVKPDEVVMIAAERSLEMVIGIFAILKAGGAYLPIPPAYPESRIQYIIKQSQTKLLLTQAQFVQILAGEAETINLEDSSIYQGKIDNPAPVNQANDLAYVIFTSGSTGEPKGVMIEHGSLVNRIHWMQKVFPLNPGDTLIQKTPFSFDVSVWEMFGWSIQGANLCILEPGAEKFPEAIAEAIEKSQVNIIHFVPSMLEAFLSYIKDTGRIGQLSSLRWVFSGGEALTGTLVKNFRETLYRQNQTSLSNLYGPAEAAIDVSYYPYPIHEDMERVPIGKPIDNIQLFIVHENQLAPIGVPGEICIAGVGLARGYINQPEMTAEKFVSLQFTVDSGQFTSVNSLQCTVYSQELNLLDSPQMSTTATDFKKLQTLNSQLKNNCQLHTARPRTRVHCQLYKTGDLGKWLPDGNIEFLGRMDHQVKIRGYRIELGEIESVLEKHPLVKQVAVIALIAENENRSLAAYIAPVQPDEFIEAKLRQYLKERVPEYMVPAHFIFLDSLPLNSSGKIDRRALPKPELNRRTGLQEAYLAPETPIQETLARIWEQILGVTQVGIRDNFFELGGDSIISIQIISKAMQAGIYLKPRQIFEHQTIEELARVAEIKQAVQAEQGRVTGEIPLTPIQHRFFEHTAMFPEHYNQALLFQIKGVLNFERVVKTMEFLLEHHDALRLRFTSCELPPGRRQVNSAVEEATIAQWFDFTDIPATEQRPAIIQKAAELQASLNISAGPLLRLAVFYTAKNGSYLYLVIHHLAVDGVSWRILMEDFETVYQQLAEAVPAQLPLKTTSFREFARWLAQQASTDFIKQEAEYWLSQPWNRIVPLPVDLPGGDNTVESAGLLAISLSEEATANLLHLAPQAYNTQINDLLLTALMGTVAEWTGQNLLFIDMEGHGREWEQEGIDLSRTIGWFTTVFPVLLQVENVNEPGEALKSVKEQLRRIPCQGRNYGVLRYLRARADADPAIREKLQSIPQPGLVFNYLGQSDQILSKSQLFEPAPEFLGPNQNPMQLRRYLIDINAIIRRGQLEVSWSYGQNLYRPETIAGLAHKFMVSIEALVDHCLAPGAGGYTPSDFPDVELSSEELEAALEEINL